MAASLRLPAIFGDNMVLQQAGPVPVWGWASPGATVRVAVAAAAAQTVAGADGRWCATLGPLEAGGPYELVVSAGGEKLALRDVLVGEVWICSGQSNMEWPLAQARDAEAEIAAADFPRMRLATVARLGAPRPKDDVVCGGWSACTPQAAARFSAVSYFFGRRLHRTLDVPVGLINVSWGGANAETWVSREALLADEHLRGLLAPLELPKERFDAMMADYQRKHAEWDAKVAHADSGIAPHARDWHSPQTTDADWPTMRIPCDWDAFFGEPVDGAIWFRREVTIPDGWAGKELALNLGAIDDFDTTFFNGVQVGTTGKETPSWWSAPRKYTVPATLVKPGRAVVAVRVFDRMGGGGMTGHGHPMSLAPRGDGAAAIDLSGHWRYKVELALKPKPMLPAPPAPAMAGQFNSPCALYNAMISGLIPLAARGFIWYQGESNANRAVQYRQLFPALIRDWRGRWGRGDMPFLFVQLANYQAAPPAGEGPGPSNWAMLREAQTMTLSLPATAQAVAIDIGESRDIHPRNKQDVGLRLALAAEATVYGHDVAFQGPMYAGMMTQGSRIRVRFDHAARLLAKAADGKLSAGAPVTGFALAGADGVYHWADATIEGATVVVSSRAVPQPVAVRYGWADDPRCNLYNEHNLPACPFRTDDWQQ